MNCSRFPLRLIQIVSLLLLSMFSAVPLYGQGVFLPASGAVNRGMGGATTGAGIEAIGSMYWNPATIADLPTNEMALGFEAIYVNYELSSTFPGVGSGTSHAENGAVPIPTIAWVHHTKDPRLTLGLGIFGVAGFSINMRGDANNPVLSPPFAQGGVGVGGIKSDAIFFQMNPALAYKFTDRLSIGFGPVISMGKIALDDNAFAPLNADGLYPRGDGTRYHWGLGAQLGFHYKHNDAWEFGMNLKTPTWFEPFRYFSEDANGFPRTDKVDVTLPLTLSTGVAYKGIPDTIVTADVRYLNYADTKGFGTPAGYLADGRITGLGFRDQFAVAVGAQRGLGERLLGRVGYLYASDLINDEDAFFNMASDLSYRHAFGGGFTLHLTEFASLSAAYNYLPTFGSSGPYNLPGIGAIPGSNVETSLDVHVATVGVNIRY